MLSEKRGADRKKMAAAIEQLVCECQASSQRVEDTSKCITLEIKAKGDLRLTLEFDSASAQPDVYVLSWHMAMQSDAKLNPLVFGGNVNTHHHQKATYIAYGFDDLLKQLRHGLSMAADGSAYLPEELPSAPCAACVAHGSQAPALANAISHLGDLQALTSTGAPPEQRYHVDIYTKDRQPVALVFWRGHDSHPLFGLQIADDGAINGLTLTANDDIPAHDQRRCILAVDATIARSNGAVQGLTITKPDCTSPFLAIATPQSVSADLAQLLHRENCKSLHELASKLSPEPNGDCPSIIAQVGDQAYASDSPDGNLTNAAWLATCTALRIQSQATQEVSADDQGVTLTFPLANKLFDDAVDHMIQERLSASSQDHSRTERYCA